MADRRKRKLDDFDPNKSDSNDSDFDIKTTRSPAKARPKGKAARSLQTNRRKPAKRVRREAYGDSEDDIEDDSDQTSDEDSFHGESSEEEEPSINPKTGRRQRAAAKQTKHYQEVTEDEIEASDLDVARPQPRPAPPLPPLPSFIVKLRVPSLFGQVQSSAVPQPAIRSRTGSKPDTRGMTPLEGRGIGARRSSRLSHDEEEPLVALTDSGRHTRVTRKGTATPEPQPQTRSTRGGKGLKKPPSAIMEISQEDMAASQDYGDAPDILSQLEQAAVSPGAKIEASDAESPFAPEAQIDEEGQEDIVPVSEDEPAHDPMQVGNVDDDDDDEDEGPIARRTSRSLRTRAKPESPPAPSRRSLRPRKAGAEQSSDFEPDADEKSVDENITSEDELQQSQKRGRKSDNDSSSGAGGRRSTRLAGKRNRSQASHDDEELDADEIADEAADLAEDRRRNKRPRRSRRDEGIAFEQPSLRNRSNRPDYRVFRPELLQQEEDDAPVMVPASQRNRRGAGGPWRSLFSTMGPFGGAGGPPPVFGGPEGIGAAGGADSDSSDDEMIQKAPRGIGGAVGMTPTSGAAPSLFPQTHNADPAQGGPAQFGKVKDKKALADADPLGVDPNVGFDSVGGLDDHIDRLKEMVALPLLYPEVFQRFHVTPPRGVLFHGPPGTGKTLLARALASSVSSHGKKVTFYMRKGADALSKWVGEAERQLRLLFEEARKNQPSIIFFDEIDGLAPVRSSKQEQIHASIVATLLALMDGMDGRGQVIVIGATNRPDSVDPALRRPGRFDREFYFPLPNEKARRAIIDINTKGWDPPLKPEFKDQLAGRTKGYGGADLRALCTEAALNAVQGTYPQIYSSNTKLLIDPSTIKVLAKDFMISVNKIVPSSERSASSGAAPLKKSIEPLLRDALARASKLLDEVIPQKKRVTALEEAMFDDREDDMGFERENMQLEFESARVFRPRLLIRGLRGMGQQYLSAALLSKFEGLHVQAFDLPTLLKDSTRSAEAAVVQLFEEIKRHKPSVIYIPDVDTWYRTLGDSVIRTFTGLLRSLPPTDPVLLLGVIELGVDEDPDRAMMRDLFGYSTKNSFHLDRPDEMARREYFSNLVDHIKRSPMEFPDPANRKKRVLDKLPEAPMLEQPKGPTKADLKAQRKQDRHTLNMLKLHIQQVMDQIKIKYRKFRTPIIDDGLIGYLYDEQNPDMLTTDLGHEQAQQLQFRPYELTADEKGVTGLRETATGKFYYNIEIVTIEKRLSNGYYKRPKDFLADIKRLAKDARTSGDPERTLKANEMVANVEVDMTNLETNFAALTAECEAVYNREQARERERLEKAQQARNEGRPVPTIVPNVPPQVSNTTGDQSSGPVHLGEDIPGQRHFPPYTPSRLPGPSSLSNGYSANASNGPQSNGSTVPSRPHEDTDMADSQDHLILTNPQERAGFADYETPDRPNTQHTYTQTSAHTQMVPGSQLRDYHNSASTTTSGNKTSDRSNRSSGPYSAPTNGSSNGGRSGIVPEFGDAGGSQLPDTQPEHLTSSQSQPASSASQSSPQGMGPPPQNRVSSNVHSLLNTDKEPTAPAARVTPADSAKLEKLHSEMARLSSGLSIEQLEQVMASLMEAVWNTKNMTDRNMVMDAVGAAFNLTMQDIERCQKVLDPSQD
ncbi:hypothetical protein MBLNU459_g4924t1 [Dothideomycetes sp. NU459]